MKILDPICAILLVIAGLNWGLWGLFQFDLIGYLCGGHTAALAKIVYLAFGAAACYRIFTMKTIQERRPLTSRA